VWGGGGVARDRTHSQAWGVRWCAWGWRATTRTPVQPGGAQEPEGCALQGRPRRSGARACAHAVLDCPMAEAPARPHHPQAPTTHLPHHVLLLSLGPPLPLRCLLRLPRAAALLLGRGHAREVGGGGRQQARADGGGGGQPCRRLAEAVFLEALGAGRGVLRVGGCVSLEQHACGVLDLPDRRPESSCGRAV